MGVKPKAKTPTLVKTVDVWKKIVADTAGDKRVLADRIIQELYGYDWESKTREVDRDQIASALEAFESIVIFTENG